MRGIFTKFAPPPNIMMLYDNLLQHLKTLTGHTGGVWCSQFEGNTIVSGSTDRSLRVRLQCLMETVCYQPLFIVLHVLGVEY